MLIYSGTKKQFNADIQEDKKDAMFIARTKT